eukprot:CAMPEP_0116898246 /NCGR_PEP_ID=MMETSP0467-20121206/7000_1 /TAXON_ID=283647 /ORGANISM="Mesodinium pulex, Strain SPMC105" /LENGTH=81 /DNA_ID=CAMNT_0004570245 /DNA_START=1652 /DNA_END=1897 /DNA_ORIENTATION=+
MNLDDEIVIEDMIQEFKLTLTIGVSNDPYFQWYEEREGAEYLILDEQTKNTLTLKRKRNTNDQNTDNVALEKENEKEEIIN